MTTKKLTGRFTVKKWTESPYMQVSPKMKMTKATVEYGFTGDLEGQAFVEYVMHYKDYNTEDRHKSISRYVGMMKFDGTLSGQEGSFVIQDLGVFEKGTAASKLEIIDGSGVGGFANIKGLGSYRSNADGSIYEFDCSI